MLDERWRKSTRSGGDNDCVEVCVQDNAVMVRHSQRPDAETIAYSFDEWRAFMQGAKDGEFDV